MAAPRTMAIGLMVLMFFLPALAGTTGAVEEPGLSPDSPLIAERAGPVVDIVLEEKLDETPADGVIEVIVQFHDQVTSVDLGYVGDLGIDVVHEYSVIPAVWLRGPAGAIERLADYKGVAWMEYNERLVYMMDRSLSTINASKTWVSPVYDRTGNEVLPGIDGTGVTAVVLDSGIDAGHPDLDYGEKVIMNLKSDSGTGPWYELENSDTSSGHGTHCAGTVGGNGDATAGGRRGVAPGANLIGLSTGEAFFITGAVGALEWVYENSRPHDNPHNIRVVSNSWGAGGGEYNPADSISQVIERIAYENNVICVFAAGNSGENDHDGSTITSSNYAATPAAISVAAMERDGSGVAVFSSRGQADLNQTFPDIGAPGVKIWSTAARRTLISSMTKQSSPSTINPYYFAISGTSMATPHVAGLVALLWQAYPGLGISTVHEAYQEGGSYVDEEHWSNPTTLVHEVEVILEYSALYVPHNEENGVPPGDHNGTRIGYTGNMQDFAQGYGLVQADRAVALALTLKELRSRDFDRDGRPDFPDATVADAYAQYTGIMNERRILGETDVLQTQWRGEWTRFNNQSNQVIPFQHDQSHLIYIPGEAELMTLELSFDPVSSTDRSIASLNLIIDYDMDGRADWSQTPGSIREGHIQSKLDLTQGGFSDARGAMWSFNIEGRGVNLPLYDLTKGDQYVEVRVEYAASVALTFGQGNGTVNLDVKHMSPYIGQLMFGEPTPGYEASLGGIEKTTFVYDLALVSEPGAKKSVSGVEPIEPWGAVLAAILVMIILYVVWYYWKHKRFPNPLKMFAKKA